MNDFYPYEDLEEQFQRFERAAARGHEESIWILSVVKDVDTEKNALREAFAMTEEPLGWYFAGKLSERDSREQFDFFKKSAEGGCSWGQVEYGLYFNFGKFVEQDKKVYVEWLEKAANQNNPLAMNRLGSWFRNEGDDKQQAVSYFRAATELGWKNSMDWLAGMLRDGEGCVRDLSQAAIWSAKGSELGVFWLVLADNRKALEFKIVQDLDWGFSKLCYSLGWGLYWYLYDSKTWKERGDENKAFGNRCLDFYCSGVELQQESIFTFLLYWNRMTVVKGPGQMIAQMVWEGKETNLLLRFGGKRESRGCILF
jgi:hypothetical protein